MCGKAGRCVRMEGLPNRQALRRPQCGREGKIEYSRFCHDHEGTYALPVDEVIHDVRSHVGSIQVQVKESMIIPHRHRALDGERVSHRWIGFMSFC